LIVIFCVYKISWCIATNNFPKVYIHVLLFIIKNMCVCQHLSWKPKLKFKDCFNLYFCHWSRQNMFLILYMYRHDTVNTFRLGPSWSWSNGSWIYNYLCNQCISPLMLWARILLRWGVLDTTFCDKVCQWLVAGLWFSPALCFPPPIKLTTTQLVLNSILVAQYLICICGSPCIYMIHIHCIYAGRCSLNS
jgi:hypothetical protein